MARRKKTVLVVDCLGYLLEDRFGEMHTLYRYLSSINGPVNLQPAGEVVSRHWTRAFHEGRVFYVDEHKGAKHAANRV